MKLTVYTVLIDDDSADVSVYPTQAEAHAAAAEVMAGALDATERDEFERILAADGFEAAYDYYDTVMVSGMPSVHTGNDEITVAERVSLMVTLEGGLVQDINTFGIPLEVLIVDHDVDELDPADDKINSVETIVDDRAVVSYRRIDDLPSDVVMPDIARILLARRKDADTFAQGGLTPAQAEEIAGYFREAVEARLREWDAEQKIEGVLNRDVNLGQTIAGLAIGYDKPSDITADMVPSLLAESPNTPRPADVIVPAAELKAAVDAAKGRTDGR